MDPKAPVVMSVPHREPESAVASYVAPDVIVDELGSGVDGIVYSSSRATAIKVHHRARGFWNELTVYRRLQEHDVRTVCGFAVPRLLGHCQERWVIEMSIVRPPFILDFAQSTIDDLPEFEDGVMAQHFEQMRRDFEDRWPVAESIYQTLERRYGIHHLDLKPRNVNFGDG